MPPTLTLTFDDGPHEDWSARVVDVLRECGARATFFMVGERVREHPALVRTILDSGNQVQLHCHRHIRHTELSEPELEQDTCDGLAALAELGAHPTHWRTPWGVRTAATSRVAARHSLTLVNWTIDTHDWRGDRAATMLARARTQLTGGGVVLMHDALGPGALRTGCANTVDLLAPLIAAARREGLDVGPLASMASDEHPVDHAHRRDSTPSGAAA